MAKRPPILPAAAVVLLLVGLVWLAAESRFVHHPAPAAGHAPSFEAGSDSPPAAPAPAGPATDEEPSHLADSLNSVAGDIHADLRTVNEIFRQYRGSTRQSNPVGENNEITAALTGRNRTGFAFIPRNNPAIDAQGQLCDRWGTPFFFHQLSGTQMEIRSAGPDHKMWTDDDQVLTPGLGEPKL